MVLAMGQQVPGRHCLCDLCGGASLLPATHYSKPSWHTPLCPAPLQTALHRPSSSLLQLADSLGQVCYLEASSARSQALYARHGFVHTADKPLGEDAEAPVLRIMVRPPAAAAKAAAALNGS